MSISVLMFDWLIDFFASLEKCSFTLPSTVTLASYSLDGVANKVAVKSPIVQHSFNLGRTRFLLQLVVVANLQQFLKIEKVGKLGCYYILERTNFGRIENLRRYIVFQHRLVHRRHCIGQILAFVRSQRVVLKKNQKHI